VQTPYVLNECGCKVKVYDDGSQAEIEFCALHRAAPELLATLKKLVRLDDEPVVRAARRLIQDIETA
jgi:hypothetical protein